MNILFIEQAEKICFFKRIFKNVELCGKKIIINEKLEKARLKKKIIIVNKIVNILEKSNCKKVVISKKLKKNKTFLNLLLSNNIDVVDGRKLFKMYILEIVEIIAKKLDIQKRECKIAILSNTFNRFVEKVIGELSQQCRFLNVVTYNIENFERLEEDLREDGVIISISNNKKKSLINSDIILNLDFPNDVLNMYNIYDKAIIVNFEEKVKIRKKRFQGKIVNWYKLELKENSELWSSIKKDNLVRYELNEVLEYFYYMGELNFEEVILAFLLKL